MAASGYKLWSSGATVTAADVNNYIQLQTVMVFASAAARNTALSGVLAEGLQAFLLDTNTLTIYTGSAWSTIGPLHGVWTSYTPTWSGTTGNGSVTGFYQRVGRTIHWRAKVAWGTTTSHGAALQSLTLPVAPSADYPTNSSVGTASSIQTGVDAWQGSAYWTASGSTINFIAGTSQASGTAARVTDAVPFTWGNGHALHAIGTYEAAADA